MTASPECHREFCNRHPRSRRRHAASCAALLVGLLPGLLAGCSIFRLGKDLEVLYSEAVFIPGQVNLDPGLRGQPVVLLVERGARHDEPEARRLVDYRFPDGRQRFNFQARAGQYELMVFLDQNRAVLGDANDGAVSLDSRLAPAMQDRANVLIGVSQDHVGILADDRTVGAVAELLEATPRR